MLTHIAREMSPGDKFLLGADLIKDPAVIDRAYNDSRGVTAAFNLNILERLNRELGADFPISEYQHRAFYSSDLHRVEMHLIAGRAHEVTIPEVGVFSLQKGESIRTELSYKYDRAMLEDILTSSGLALETWMPADDGAFVLALARAEA
jgi:L-histidine N-alpha-methyltransferase